MSIRATIAERLSRYDRVVVWGAGGLGANALRNWLPLQKVAAVIDSNPAKAGQSVAGIAVRSPEVIRDMGAGCIVICTHAHVRVRDAVKQSGLDVPVFYVYELFVPQAGWKTMSPLAQLCVDITATKNDIWPIFVLKKPQIAVNATFRTAQWARSSSWGIVLYPLLYVLHYLMCIVFSIQLPLEAKIGPGLIFAHFGTIVLTGRASIGCFFTIYHGCTVGTDSDGAGPLIGDFVTQFAGAHVLGNCRIGNNVRVGANAVVLGLTVPDGASAVGVPAKVVGHAGQA